MIVFWHRIQQRIYWFYVVIVREKKPGMLFFYSVAGLSAIVGFYTLSLIVFLGVVFNIDFFKFSNVKYSIVLLCPYLLSLFFFYTKRKALEPILRKGLKIKPDIYDLLVVIFIISSFSIFFYSLCIVAQFAS